MSKDITGVGAEIQHVQSIVPKTAFHTMRATCIDGDKKLLQQWTKSVEQCQNGEECSLVKKE